MDERLVRQKDLDLRVPEHVTVLGAGGVGSWVVMLLRLAGVKRITVWDYDLLEIHNLNRTPYAEEHVGLNKALALSIMFDEVEPIQEAYDFQPLTGIVFDCRDVGLPVNAENVVKLGYDGTLLTFHGKPDHRSVLGEGSGYETTPSYVVPPVVLAALAVDYVLQGKDFVPGVRTVDVHELSNRFLGGEA